MHKADDRNPPNPFGIHFQKASLIVVLFFIHAEAWVNTAAKQEVNISDSLFWRILLFFGTFNILVPTTAGAMLRVAGNFTYENLRLRPFAWKPVLWLCLVLGFLESAKAALSVNFEIFFAWDVLHLIALSTLVILLLARLSVLAVWASAIGCIVLTPFLRQALVFAQISDVDRITQLNDFKVAQIFLFLSALLVFLLTGWRLIRSDKFQRKYKVRMLLILILLYNLSTYLIFTYSAPFYFVARIVNLPVGILVGDQLGLHWWPFFPWYSQIALGFCTYDLLARNKSALLRVGIFGAAILMTTFYYKYDFPIVVTEYNRMTGWSAKLFQGSLSLLYLSIAMFAGNAVFWDFICNLKGFNRWLDKYPILYEIPLMFSRTILFSYLFINVFGPPLASPFAHYLPLPWALVMAPLFDLFLWAILGRALMRFLSTKGLVIQFSNGVSK